MSTRRFAPGVLVVVCVVVLGVVGGAVGFTGTASGQQSVLVENDISSDTTWERGSGPYRIVKDVTVTDGATLTIEPGVRVEVAEDVSLTIEGNLQAVGESDAPIVFTSSKDSPSPGSWETLRLAGSYGSLTRIHHTKISFATDGVSLAGNQRVSFEHVEINQSSSAAINGTDSSGYAPTGEITIEDSALHDNQFGIRGYDERFSVIGTSITDNAREGIYLTNRLDIADITVRDSVVARNDIGIRMESATDQHNRGGVIREVTIHNTTVRQNAGDGIRLFGDRLVTVALTESRVAANGGIGVQIQDTGNDGGANPTQDISVTDTVIEGNGAIGLRLAATYSSLRGVEIRGNEIGRNGDAGAQISADRTTSEITLADTGVWLNDGDGITVSGSETSSVGVTDLRTFGNEGNGVAVNGSSISDIEVVSSRSSLNGKAGVLVNGTSDAVATTVADSVLAANADGLVIMNHQSSIEGSVIEFNNATGVRYAGERSTGNVIDTTDFYGNRNGVWVPEGADEVVANVTNNYWGAASGPHHASVNPEGEGDSVNGGLAMVEFLPYAETPFGEVNERPEATVEVPSDPVEPGTPVTISAAQSTDDGEVQWYRYTFNNSTNTDWTRDAELTRTFEHPGTYLVNVTVADDHGVPSEQNATATITVEAAGEDSNGDDGDTSDGDGSGSNDGSDGDGTDGQDGDGNGEELDVQIPGFGVPVAILSVLLGVFVLRRMDST